MNAAQREARSEHGLAPAPRCATPAPARGAAERRRDGEAPAWRLGHDAARATLGRPDDPGGRAISLRRVGLGETWTGVDLVWGRRGSHYEQSWCPLPPLAPPKREREFVVGRCTGGLGACPSLRWVGLRGSPPMSGQRDPLIA